MLRERDLTKEHSRTSSSFPSPRFCRRHDVPRVQRAPPWLNPATQVVEPQRSTTTRSVRGKAAKFRSSMRRTRGTCHARTVNVKYSISDPRTQEARMTDRERI